MDESQLNRTLSNTSEQWITMELLASLTDLRWIYVFVQIQH